MVALTSSEALADLIDWQKDRSLGEKGRLHHIIAEYSYSNKLKHQSRYHAWPWSGQKRFRNLFKVFPSPSGVTHKFGQLIDLWRFPERELDQKVIHEGKKLIFVPSAAHISYIETASHLSEFEIFICGFDNSARNTRSWPQSFFFSNHSFLEPRSKLWTDHKMSCGLPSMLNVPDFFLECLVKSWSAIIRVSMSWSFWSLFKKLIDVLTDNICTEFLSRLAFQLSEVVALLGPKKGLI